MKKDAVEKIRYFDPADLGLPTPRNFSKMCCDHCAALTAYASGYCFLVSSMFDHSIHRTVWIMSDRAPSSRKRKVARKTVAAEAEKASRRKQLPRMTASKNWNVNLPREVTQSKERKVTKDPTEEELRIIQDNDCKSGGNDT